jgi:hypothetical protein
LAFGSTFYQLAGQPLVINIADLMWSDYDPDGEPIFFVGVSATTSNGLVLTTQPTQILIPANSVPDAFSYTIADDRGVTASSTATIFIITNVTSRIVSLDRDIAGNVTMGCASVPWYTFECQRATNVTFTGTIRSWPAQAWADGSIFVWDDFADLTNKPPQAFYRMLWMP